jgi:GNAT superfamily N-acetyltransferase
MENPFGRSLMLVAMAGDRVIGLRAFLRWRFRADGREVRAARAVDTATDPEHQGRGVFSRLTGEAVSLLRSDTDLIFNTPNERSGPGYLKMGWRVVGTVRVSIRPRRPVRFARGARASGTPRTSPRGPRPVPRAPRAAEILAHPGIDGLLESAPFSVPGRLATPRDDPYLRWRYATAPFDYRGLVEEEDGRLVAAALFRVRPRGWLWETSVTDLMAKDRRAARRLVRRVIRAADVDHVACRFPQGSAAAAAIRRAGFLRSPRGPTLVINPLGQGIRPDPRDIRSWGFTLGDLEVF